MSNETQMNAASVIPTWFKAVSIIALIWNLLGVGAFFGQIMITPEMLAQLPEAEQALYMDIPLWVNVAFACAVLGGAIGCVLLIIKKSAAFYVLLISLVGVCVQMYHSFFISNSIEVYGPGGMVMPIMVIVIGVGLVWLAFMAKGKAWLG